MEQTVGATIGRPAEIPCVFADATGENMASICRAGNARPYNMFCGNVY